MPTRNVHKAAKEKAIYKMSWKHHACAVLSTHGKLCYSAETSNIFLLHLL